MALHQCARVTRICLEVQDSARMRVKHSVAAHTLVAGKPNDGSTALRNGKFSARLCHKTQGLRAGGQCCRRVFGGSLRRTSSALRPRGFLDGLIRVDMRVDAAGAIDLGGIPFKPSCQFRVVRTPHKCSAANIVNAFDWFVASQAMGHLYHCTLGISVQEQVSLAIDQD